MTTKEKECNERVNKILYGLEMTYEKLLAEKKANNRDLIVISDNKIVAIKP